MHTTVSTYRPRRIRVGAAACCVSALLLLAGCVGGSHGSSAKPTGAVSTSVTSEKVTLTIADFDAGPTVKEMIAAFEAAHPNITIKRQYTSATDYQKSISLTMQSSTPPDIAQYNTPMRDLNAAGLILDLTPYERAYSWDSVIPRSLLDQTRLSTDGKTLGTGKLIGAPFSVPLVGVYENTAVATQAGITAQPSTLSDFEADLAKAKAANLLPLELGSSNFGGIHNWAALLNAYVPRDQLRGWLFGASGATIDTPAATQATDTLASWAKQGYYPASANGTIEQDAETRFASGSSVFTIDGSWAAAPISDKLGANLAFFLLPQAHAGDPVVANASVAAFSVSSKTKHPNEAASFLNFMYSQGAAQSLAAEGYFSLNPKVTSGATGVSAQVSQQYAKVAQSNGALIFPDQTAPAMLDELTSGLQQIIAGSTSSGPFLGKVQSVWTSYHQGS